MANASNEMQAFRLGGTGLRAGPLRRYVVLDSRYTPPNPTNYDFFAFVAHYRALGGEKAFR
ncbi:MAG: hypothetical protein FWE28_08065 [Oscillospiraceae bacterium]|nr:hypothetical protein [Oscillospiraceae bacterium]